MHHPGNKRRNRFVRPERKQTATGRVSPFRWSGLLNDRRLIIGVIALLVVALGWGLYHAVQRMDDMPKDT